MKKQFIQPAIYVAAFSKVNVICTSEIISEEEVTEQWAPERQVPTEFELIY